MVTTGILSNLDAAKKLAQLNPELSQEYFSKVIDEQDLDALWNEVGEA